MGNGGRGRKVAAVKNSWKERWKEGWKEGRRDRRRERGKEGGREGRKEGRKEGRGGRREGEIEGGREGRKEGEREGKREGGTGKWGKSSSSHVMFMTQLIEDDAGMWMSGRFSRGISFHTLSDSDILDLCSSSLLASNSLMI